MPKQTKAFTEKFLQNLKPEKTAYNRTHNGLRIRVYPSGRKTWSYYKVAPNRRRTPINIGDYPEVSLKSARDIADRIRGEQLKLGHDIATHGKGITFGDYIKLPTYLNWSKANRKSHQAIINNLNSVIPKWFMNIELHTFTHNDLQRFVDERLKVVEMNSTINKNLNNIKSVFSHALKSGVIKENPTKNFSKLKETNSKEKLSLTDIEREKLIEVSKDQSLPQAKKRDYMYLFIQLGLQCGLRKAEICSLKWGNFKNDAAVNKKRSIDISPKETAIRDITFINRDNDDFKSIWYIEVLAANNKSGRTRYVPIPHALYKDITAYLRVREMNAIIDLYQDEVVFIDDAMTIHFRNNEPVYGYFDEIKIIPVEDPKKSYATLCRLARMPNGVTIHTLRHDYCTRLVKSGVDIHTVQQLAGHKDIRTTMKYVHSVKQKDFSGLKEFN